MSKWKNLTILEIECISNRFDVYTESQVEGQIFLEIDYEKYALAIQEALKVKNEEMACIKLLADIRQAFGDNGNRMQDELVQYITELYRQAESVEHLQHRVSELEDTLKRQGNAAKSGMDAAKRAASQSEENAKRLLAESNPESLESERAANAELSREVEWVQARVSELEAGQQSVSVPKVWKPISTAPMDGTQILLCTLTGKIADGMFSQRYKVWSWPYVMVDPTHWMQRPEPASQEKDHDE